MNAAHYSMIIQWDEHDKIYIISVPELPGCKTHGRTYEEAIKNALEVIELWIEDAQKAGEPVPPPRVAALA
ncbi:MAG: type II toxin-antitoxin system HicB family antitoxin [Ktedonobacteraceae bacterium]